MITMATPTVEALNEIPVQPVTQKPEQTALVTYSVPCPDISLIDFLRHGANGPRMYWENDNISVGFAAFGVAAKLTADGPDRFQTIQQDAHRLFEKMILLDQRTPAGIGPRLFGGFAFRSTHQAHGLWSAFPTACFILPRYQLTRLNDEIWLTINHQAQPGEKPTYIKQLLRDEMRHLQQLTYNSNGNNGSQNSTPSVQHSSGKVEIQDLMQPEIWHHLVSTATHSIRRGDLEKVVLARARQMHAPRPVEPVDILTQLNHNYPNCYRFLFEPIPGHAFYGATPELLAEVNGSTLRTVALAGSIRRGETAEEDRALGRQLLDNPKERNEHALVVEAIEENLTPLAAKLRIAPQPGLCRLSNIQHIQTTIEADLTEAGNVLSVVEALHPTPALGGRPRHKALSIIHEAEPTPRGWYGSPIGWLDHQNNGMFAVAIRSAVSVGNDSMLFAGAGIVADSEPGKEWRETQLKFKPLMDALQSSAAG